MFHDNWKAIESNWFLPSDWDFFPKLYYSFSAFLHIGSVFIWFVLSSMHVYVLFTFLQNISSGWKGEFSMLTSNKGGKYRELHVATGGCETLCSSLDYKFTHFSQQNISKYFESHLYVNWKDLCWCFLVFGFGRFLLG